MADSKIELERENLLGAVTHLAKENEQLRGELSLAEEGLANYAQENAQLRALLTQAPIAKVTVRESFGGDVLDWVMCAPGLPPGEHDLYLMPSVPQSERIGEKHE